MIEPRDEFVTPTRPGAAPQQSAGQHHHPPLPEEHGEPAPVPADAAPPSSGEPVPGLTEDQVKLVLRRVKDPELSLNVIDLGLIYSIAVEGSTVKVDMSLTSPGCPSGPEIMGDVERQLRSLEGVTDVQVNLVWTPYWTPDRIEPRVRAYLGF